VGPLKTEEKRKTKNRTLAIHLKANLEGDGGRGHLKKSPCNWGLERERFH